MDAKVRTFAVREVREVTLAAAKRSALYCPQEENGLWVMEVNLESSRKSVQDFGIRLPDASFVFLECIRYDKGDNEQSFGATAVPII